MLKHNLTLFFRSIKRYKSSFLINLIGLSTGLACALFIYLWVNDELNVDKFHEKDSQLFQVMINRHNSEEIFTQIHGPGLLAKALTDEMPEVEKATSFTSSFMSEKNILSVKNINIKAKGDYVGKEFFNIFSFELIHGDKNQVLANNSSIVVSEKLATKFFGTTENIIGKTIELEHEKQFNISGVFETIPTNSTYQFDYLLPYDVYAAENKWMLAWDNNAPGTFIVLKEGTDINKFNEKIAGFVKSKYEESNVTLFLRSYSDGYLYGNYENGAQAGGRIEYVRLFSVVAIFILLIACINFMNLSTAHASRRAREVGVKKAVGARRKAIIKQYLGESLLMTFLSLTLAALFVIIFLPQFNEVTGKNLSFTLDTDLVLYALGITLFTGLIAGSYPALYLSGFNPVAVLKGRLSTSFGELWIRKGLVVFQFALSVVLIVSVLVVYKQIEYIQTKNIGYNKDNIIYFQKEGKVAEDLEPFLSQIKNIPGVANASSMRNDLVAGGTTTYGVEWDNKDPDDVIDFHYRMVNYDLIETLKIEMAEGRSFSKDFSSDSSAIVFNETAIKIMGLKNPIGKIVRFWDVDLKIVGVTKDFQFESMYENVKPLCFIISPDSPGNVMIRIQAGMEKEVISKLGAFCKEYNPGYLFEYKFMDETFQAQYVAEERVATLSKYFAGLAIIISCLGLFGLAAFTAERRRKEIGVRKTLGQRKSSIVLLLSGEFAKLVLIATIIGLPLAYLITKDWLNNFAYHIPLQFWYFILAGFLTMVVAILTVSTQAINAANKKTVDALREE